MAERRPLGDILLESGRITKADVDDVLKYQREHGGFFGQGLVALGVVSPGEIDWALASQFDLPLIFPNAGAVDREVAHLVPADWALAHLAVPILRAGDTIRMVVADPLRDEVIDDVRERTGCNVEIALASADRIRLLIHTLYAEPRQERTADYHPLTLSDLIGQALDNGADRFGLSIRGVSAVGWWHGRGQTRRAPLSDGWNQALLESVRPAWHEQFDEATRGRVEWQATLSRGGSALQLEAQALVGEGGCELLFRPVQKIAAPAPPGDLTMPQGLVTELRLLWRGGGARVGVSAPENGTTLLTILPALALGDHVRAVHVNETGVGHGVYTLRAEDDDRFVASLEACAFDALTIDLPPDRFPVESIMNAAPLSFALVTGRAGSGDPKLQLLNWLLTVTGQPGEYAWDLRALHH